MGKFCVQSIKSVPSDVRCGGYKPDGSKCRKLLARIDEGWAVNIDRGHLGANIARSDRATFTCYGCGMVNCIDLMREKARIAS